VLSKPDDLDERLLSEVLIEAWAITPVSLVYRDVGFGSHHWLSTDSDGGRFFVTVDDLKAKLWSGTDTPEAAFARLDSAFRTARTLRDEAGLAFVVAPLLTADGAVLRRVSDRYALAVYPHLDVVDRPAALDLGASAHRSAALDMVVAVHAATSIAAHHAQRDDFVLPYRDELEQAIAEVDRPWESGPYAEKARSLLGQHAIDLGRLLSTYDRLADGARRNVGRMVLTHGEPHAGNVLETREGWSWVDWDTTLVAPPERDLWMLGPADGAAADAYTLATGTPVLPEGIDLYRLGWDLTEICLYITGFWYQHEDSADDAQRWMNLLEYLNPRDRWSSLF
jgi:spectinomycin phosphotransferase/16S rRNA (guanine(1405)-N(7))-methyltransferase